MNRLILLFILLSLLTPLATNAQNTNDLEIFDIHKGKVIHRIPTNEEIQHEVEVYLEEISDVLHKFDPIPKSGHMIKVPLEPGITVNNEWVHTLLNEVIIILTEKEEPYLMLFDDENSVHFFTFNGEVSTLLEILDFHP